MLVNINLFILVDIGNLFLVAKNNKQGKRPYSEYNLCQKNTVPQSKEHCPTKSRPKNFGQVNIH